MFRFFSKHIYKSLFFTSITGRIEFKSEPPQDGSSLPLETENVPKSLCATAVHQLL